MDFRLKNHRQLSLDSNLVSLKIFFSLFCRQLHFSVSDFCWVFLFKKYILFRFKAHHFRRKKKKDILAFSIWLWKMVDPSTPTECVVLIRTTLFVCWGGSGNFQTVFTNSHSLRLKLQKNIYEYRTGIHEYHFDFSTEK